MATYKAVLHHRKRTDKTRRLQIRITKDRKSTYIPLEIYLEEKHFNESKGEVKTSHSMQAVWNALIRKKIEELRKEEANLEVLEIPGTAKDIRKEFKEKVTTNFLAFYKKHIEFIQEKKSKNTGTRHSFHLIKMEKFLLNYQDITIQKIGIDFVEKFQRWLLNIPNKQSTANKDIEVLATVMGKAVKRGLIAYHKNPFHDFKYTKDEANEKDVLEVEEFIKCYEYNDDSKNINLVYKDAFVAMFLAAGMRVGDAFQLKVKNYSKGRLKYTMDKSKKTISLSVNGILKIILEKYSSCGDQEDFIFPILNPKEDIEKQLRSKTTNMNVTLKAIAGRLGINKHITSHVARHSFSNSAMEKTENVVRLQGALGHSDLKTTLRYIQKYRQLDNDDLIEKATN